LFTQGALGGVGWAKDEADAQVMIVLTPGSSPKFMCEPGRQTPRRKSGRRVDGMSKRWQYGYRRVTGL